jgi:hypothetical protein
LFNEGFLVDEYAAHVQREQAAAASRSHQVRLATQVQRCIVVPDTLLGRLIAPFRPATQSCPANT